MCFDDHGHILCAAVADFDGISIKYFVELARSREVLVNHPQKSFDVQPLLSNVPTFSFMYRLSHGIKGSFDL